MNQWVSTTRAGCLDNLRCRLQGQAANPRGQLVPTARAAGGAFRGGWCRWCRVWTMVIECEAICLGIRCFGLLVFTIFSLFIRGFYFFRFIFFCISLLQLSCDDETRHQQSPSLRWPAGPHTAQARYMGQKARIAFVMSCGPSQCLPCRPSQAIWPSPVFHLLLADPLCCW